MEIKAKNQSHFLKPTHVEGHQLNSKNFLVFSEEVTQAQAEGKPIVALESTIIAHGMPYPDNVKTALEVEEIVRQHGAIPATIAVLDGKIKIGLSEEEIQFLATSDQVAEVDRRDLPYIVSTGKHGATTVAATMICAQLAGIELFVTGGIGGVHREGEKTMDILLIAGASPHQRRRRLCRGQVNP